MISICFLQKNVRDILEQKDKDIANFLEQDKYNKINIVKIKDNNKLGQISAYNKVKEDVKDSNNFMNNIIFKISDYSSYSEYIISKNDFNNRIKRYFGIKEIIDELKKIKTQTLPERKSFVKKIIEKNILPIKK